MKICGSTNPDESSMLCTKAEHPFGMHAHDPSGTYWDGLPIPSPQDHKKNRALMEEIVVASAVKIAPPVLSYGDTSGWSGSSTSEERAREEDENGTTSERQAEVIRLLTERHGLTWKEVADIKGWHHGQASGALSGLHKAGLICRLSERRGNSQIYVVPADVSGRPTEEYGRKDRVEEARAMGYAEGYAQGLADARTGARL